MFAMLMSAVYKAMPVVLDIADNVTENSFMTRVVQWAAGIGGAIIAIFLIIAIVKDGLAYAKSGGSILPIIGKVLFLILCIGLIFLAVNYASLGNTASDIAGKAVEQVNSEASNILPQV